MSTSPIDYAALAEQARGTDYAALANQARGEEKGFFESALDSSGVSALLHPIDTITGLPAMVRQAGSNIADAYRGVRDGAPDAAQRVARAVPIAGPIAETMAGQAEAGNYSGMLGTYLGAGAGVAGPKALKEFKFAEAADSAAKATASNLQKVGDAAQDVAVNRVNKTVGSIQADFDHGANPGRQYLQSRLGVAAGMKAIAAKANAALEDVGKKLGDAYAAATEGMAEIPPDNVTQPRLTGGSAGQLPGATAKPRIPVQRVFDALAKPVQEAHASESGFGGSGNTAGIEAYAQRLAPELDKAMMRGGFTPKELFDLKQKLTRNTKWKATSELENTLNSIRQDQYGAIVGLLDEYVPSLKPLNQAYQSLKKLADRAEIRSKTGSEPLTNFKEKGYFAGGGAALGTAVGGPGFGTLVGGLAGLAADSIPSKTAVASGLYRGGEALANAGSKLEKWLRSRR